MKRKLISLVLATVLCTVSVGAMENPFTDVDSDSALAQSVLWALEEGITAGVTDTTFAPESTCTRGQVVTFLWHAKGEPTPTITENPFTDVAETSSFYTAVLWAVEQGITTGTGDGTTFSPTATCTSGQVVTFLYRAMGEPTTTYESAYADGAAAAFVSAINWADETGLLADMDFSASAPSPRSDIVTYLYRDAGSPAIEITQPEAPSYAYTMPTVEEPGTATATAEYFNQVFLYMMVNDLESYDCYFSDVTGSALEAQGLATTIDTACFYIKTHYIELGGFYTGYAWTYAGNSNSVTLTVKLVGHELSNQQVTAYKAAFLDSIQATVTDFYATGELKETDSDYTKALYFYTWCAVNLKYDTTYQDASYHGYGTLTNGTGVCQGYVSVFNAMCNCAGIDAYGVTGTTSDGSHIWSYLNLDGTWLYADPTFGDPLPNTPGYCDTSFFAVTKDFLSATHVFD